MIGTGRAIAVVLIGLGAVGCAGTEADTQSSSTASVSTTLPVPSTTNAPSTTIDTGPPTLAPGDSLPTPEPPPDPDSPDPDIYIGTIEIPAIMLESPVFQGISEPTLDRGVGWWPGTARPGQVGNVVLAGHRTSHDKPFRYLDLLQPGDEIVLSTTDGRFVYSVDRTEIVLPDDIWIIEQSETASLTLFACHPLHSVKQRIVVFADFARRVDA